AGCDEVVVRQRGAEPGVLLDVDLVTGPGQLVHSGRSDCHPVFVVLDLARDPDSHDPSPPRMDRRGAVAATRHDRRSVGRADGCRVDAGGVTAMNVWPATFAVERD